jgi:hypothetical protein
MQTYLPYSDQKINAAALSEKDLGHQINAAMTILETNKKIKKGWQWHPGIKMWIGHDDFLAQYIARMLFEWKVQGWTDTFKVHDRMIKMGYHEQAIIARKIDPPWWWGVKRFHAGQKASLLRHDREWYGRLFTNISAGLCEWWPVQTEGNFIYGPQPAPDGRFDYILDGKPMFPEVSKMSDNVFMRHANTFHRLMKSDEPLTSRDQHLFGSLRAHHDRLHTLRTYDTHGHVQ